MNVVGTRRGRYIACYDFCLWNGKERGNEGGEREKDRKGLLECAHEYLSSVGNIGRRKRERERVSDGAEKVCRGK